MKPVLRLAGLFMLFLAAASCAVNPVTGRQELTLISEQQEVEIGRNSDPEVLERYGYYPDSELQGYVRSIGESLAMVSHRPGLAYFFSVVDSSNINAFALPGGYVYVTRGMLGYLNNEAELAGVLGHELGHITERHAVQQLSASLGLQLTSVLLSSAVEGAGQFSQVTDLLFSGIMNGYGRGQEFSSDRLGQEYMSQAGFDPHAVPGFLSTLQRKRGKGLDPITHWLVSSHPYTAERLQRALDYAKELDVKSEAKTRNQERYLLQIDGLVYGDGERDGIVMDQRYLNRYHRVGCAIPADWKIQRDRGKWVARTDDPLMQIRFEVEKFRDPVDMKAYVGRAEERSGLQRGEFLGSQLQGGFEIFSIRYRAKSDSRTVSVFGGYGVHGHTGVTVLGISLEGQEGRMVPAWLQVLGSLRELSESEARSVPMRRIQVHRVRTGDTFEGLANKYMNDRRVAEEIAEINGMKVGKMPAAGTLIKVIVDRK